MTAALLIQIAAFAAGGVALGFAYFASLRLVTRLYVETDADGHGRWRGIALHVARIVVLVAALVGAAKFGALPLLAAAGGILIGRAVVLARVRSAA
jgi:hypothetical protein